MKNKLKRTLAIILIIITIIISNLGQLFLSDEQFTKEEDPIKLKQ